MNLEEIPKEREWNTYQEFIKVEMSCNPDISREQAVKNVEAHLFFERIEQLTWDDLVEDEDGSWTTFEDKVRKTWPEIPPERFRGFKDSAIKHLCGY